MILLKCSFLRLLCKKQVLNQNINWTKIGNMSPKDEFDIYHDLPSKLKLDKNNNMTSYFEFDINHNMPH